ncbi:hypothetical protein I7I50_08139 [Histoplasma capsulatum G186AR]|uniref:Uncharacterized protein n=1 Tax=Ajellomyces capsulatus TaxID=5037 RepID=A0A8H7YFC4_AJECA|nr:hypothetical protein I7I52_08655 [Histoplasma capsulatum]QSS68657.1 hypothetical protein I7I50_08139 [Histoplasma capsulatum G186AR]
MPERPRGRPAVAHEIGMQRICDPTFATEVIPFDRWGDDAAGIDVERRGERVDHFYGRSAAAFGDEDVAGDGELERKPYCSLVIWLVVSSLQRGLHVDELFF